MKKFLFLVCLLNSSYCFPQFDFNYFNHNNCDIYTSDFGNKQVLNNYKLPTINKHFRLSKLYKNSDTLTQQNIINSISSNVLINGVLYFEECFDNNLCNCYVKSRLDTIQKIYSKTPRIYKLCGVYKFNKNSVSYFVTSQEYIDTTGNTEFCHFITTLYMINTNLSHKVISTACIGYYEIFNDGLSNSKYDTEIKISSDTIISKTIGNTTPIDIIYKGKQNIPDTIYVNKFQVLNDGKILFVK